MPEKDEDKNFQEYFRKVLTTPVKQVTPWKSHEFSYYKEVIRRPTTTADISMASEDAADSS